MENVNWQRVRDILISAICIGIILWATASILGQFLHVIVLLLLSMALAFLLTPAVNYLARQKYIPRLVAAFIVYVVVLVAFVGIGYLLVFSLIKQVQSFSATVINFVTTLPVASVATRKWLVDQGIPESTITSALAQIQGQATSFAQSLATNALNILLTITDTFVTIILLLVLSFYLALDGKHIRDSIFSVIPKRSQSFFILSEEALNRVVGSYIRGQLTLAVIIGVLAGGGTALLGLQGFALVIGVLAFFFETIPMVGPVLACIPAIIVSLLLPDPFPRTFWIVGYFIVIQLIEGYVLGPRIVGHAIGLHPFVSIFALIVGAQLFGAFGALIATPIVAAAWVVIASLYRSARGQTADHILATSKRAAWVLPPSYSQLLKVQGTRPLETDHPVQDPPTVRLKPTLGNGKTEQ